MKSKSRALHFCELNLSNKACHAFHFILLEVDVACACYFPFCQKNSSLHTFSLSCSRTVARRNLESLETEGVKYFLEKSKESPGIEETVTQSSTIVSHSNQNNIGTIVADVADDPFINDFLTIWLRKLCLLDLLALLPFSICDIYHCYRRSESGYVFE